MKDIFDNISLKLRGVLSIVGLFLAGLTAFFAYSLYFNTSISDEKLFKSISAIEIILIAFIGFNLYKLIKEDAFLKSFLDAIREEHYEGDIIFNTISDGIAVIDLKGKVKTVNQGLCKILGIDGTKVMNKNIYDIYAGLSVDHESRILASLIIETLETNNEYFQQEKIYIKDNESRYLTVSTYLLKGKSKKLLGVLCVVHDFTERKKIEQQMIQIEKLALAGQLAAELAHEIRNPICSIKGLVQVMSKKHGMENGYYYNVVMNEIDRISALLKDFLSLTHAKSVFKEISITQVFADILPILESQAYDKNITISMNVEDNLPCILADQEHLKQVIINIVQNAIDAVKNNGKIDIRIQKNTEEGKIKLEFKDNGVGIRNEHLQKIFDPFFTTKENGSGLGLVISQRIIEKHKGKLYAYNNPEGGSTFAIELPDMNRYANEDRSFKVS